MYSTSSQVYALAGFSSSEVSQTTVETLIDFADAEIDSLFNRSFNNGTPFVEYVSLYLPKRADDIAPNRFVLTHYPIQSLSQVLLIGATSNTNTVLGTISNAAIVLSNWQTADYFVDPSYGLVELTSHTVQYSPSKVKVTGTYGYADVPKTIQELSAVMTGIRGWVNFLGGNYDRLNRYKLPEQEYDKGDFYDRGLKAVDKLTDRANFLVALIGEKYRSQFFATSGGYF